MDKPLLIRYQRNPKGNQEWTSQRHRIAYKTNDEDKQQKHNTEH